MGAWSRAARKVIKRLLGALRRTGRPPEGIAEYPVGIAASARAALSEELGLDPELLAKVQMEAAELRPIVAAIKERPGCSLLVFGCGNDSLFWETANGGGTTAFLEDNPGWAVAARSRLTSAKVYPIHYGTRQFQWRWLLDRPGKLEMGLPEAVSAMCWDVVIVDAPAGYAISSPGRMKAIYTASKLVAPGGRVFVHDCERQVEAAYAARYLGEDRLVVETTGRALLRGYAF